MGKQLSKLIITPTFKHVKHDFSYRRITVIVMVMVYVLGVL